MLFSQHENDKRLWRCIMFYIHCLRLEINTLTNQRKCNKRKILCLWHSLSISNVKISQIFSNYFFRVFLKRNLTVYYYLSKDWKNWLYSIKNGLQILFRMVIRSFHLSKWNSLKLCLSFLSSWTDTTPII